MNILIIIDQFDIFEVNSGGALRNNLFVKALSEIGHVNVICFSKNGVVSNIPNCDVVFSHLIVDDKDIKEAIRELVCETLRPSDPYSYFKVNKKKAAIIDEFVNRYDYDIIACRYVESAIKCGLIRYKNKLVIDVDDNPSNAQMRRADATNSVFYKWKKLYDSILIKRMLNKLLNGIHSSFCSNPIEIPCPRTILLHNTTVLKTPASDIAESIRTRILFVGRLVYSPVKQGITHFVEYVLPLIKNVIPTLELRIVGSGEPDFLAYLNSKESVRAVGAVDDLTPEYQEAAVVVVPIYYGSGTSVKFIEALLMNRPVVSSPVGARGFLYMKDDEDYMLALNDKDFAAKVIELLSSVSKSREMAKNGYEKANKYYSQEKFIEIVKNAIIEQGIK